MDNMEDRRVQAICRESRDGFGYLFLVLIGVDWIHLDSAVWWADRMMIR